MITKKDLKVYGYKEVTDFYYNILDSYTNGNFTQLREQFKKLSQEQRTEFINFIEEINFNERFNLMGFLLKG